MKLTAKKLKNGALYYNTKSQRVERMLGTEVVTYAAQEPGFTTQLPQILAGLGFRYLKHLIL